jgi:hypothetical protein
MTGFLEVRVFQRGTIGSERAEIGEAHAAAHHQN